MAMEVMATIGKGLQRQSLALAMVMEDMAMVDTAMVMERDLLRLSLAMDIPAMGMAMDLGVIAMGMAMERDLLKLNLAMGILAMDMVRAMEDMDMEAMGMDMFMARDLLKLNPAMDTLAMAMQIEDMAMDMAEDMDITKHILQCDSRVQETSVVFQLMWILFKNVKYK